MTGDGDALAMWDPPAGTVATRPRAEPRRRSTTSTTPCTQRPPSCTGIGRAGIAPSASGEACPTRRPAGSTQRLLPGAGGARNDQPRQCGHVRPVGLADRHRTAGHHRLDGLDSSARLTIPALGITPRSVVFRPRHGDRAKRRARCCCPIGRGLEGSSTCRRVGSPPAPVAQPRSNTPCTCAATRWPHRSAGPRHGVGNRLHHEPRGHRPPPPRRSERRTRRSACFDRFGDDTITVDQVDALKRSRPRTTGTRPGCRRIGGIVVMATRYDREIDRYPPAISPPSTTTRSPTPRAALPHPASPQRARGQAVASTALVVFLTVIGGSGRALGVLYVYGPTFVSGRG